MIDPEGQKNVEIPAELVADTPDSVSVSDCAEAVGDLAQPVDPSRIGHAVRFAFANLIDTASTEPQ